MEKNGETTEHGEQERGKRSIISRIAVNTSL